MRLKALLKFSGWCLSLASLVSQDIVDDGVDVGDIHLAVIVRVAVGTADVAQDGIDDDIDIGDIHLAVAVHVTSCSWLLLNAAVERDVINVDT